MRKPLLIILLTTLLLLGTGCMTGGVWSEAGPERMEEPFVAGHVSVASDNGGAERPTALVVSYSLPYTFRPHQPPRLWVRVPLDAAGAPAEPFAYRGAAAAKSPADVMGRPDAGTSRRGAGGDGARVVRPRNVTPVAGRLPRVGPGDDPTWTHVRAPPERRADLCLPY